MNDLLKGKLEAALQAAGLTDKGLLSFVTVEKEEDIKGVVDNLKLMTQKPSLEDILKMPEVQSLADRRVTDALKKRDEKNPEPPKPQGDDSLEEKLAALLEAKLSPLSEKLEGFQKEKARDLRIAEARKALMESKIPENLRDQKLKYFNPDAEIETSEWVKGQELEHETLIQTLIDSGSLSKPIEVRKSATEVNETEVDEILQRISK